MLKMRLSDYVKLRLLTIFRPTAFKRILRKSKLKLKTWPRLIKPRQKNKRTHWQNWMQIWKLKRQSWKSQFQNGQKMTTTWKFWVDWLTKLSILLVVIMNTSLEYLVYKYIFTKNCFLKSLIFFFF
jgi:hypothetical protein